MRAELEPDLMCLSGDYVNAIPFGDEAAEHLQADAAPELVFAEAAVRARCSMPLGDD